MPCDIVRLFVPVACVAVLPCLTAWAGEPTNAKEMEAKKAAEEKAINEKFQQWKAKLSAEQQAWEKTLEDCLGSFYLPLYKREKVAGRESAWDYVKDDPKLPRVLLIGDSISRGYTQPVRQALKGKVNLHRAPANCGGTANALKKLDLWLGNGKWDVIHVNFGIHDRKTPPAEYEQRLETIVTRLKATKAKVIWASTTPIPDGVKDQSDADSVRCNEIAARVMAKHGVPINDLYTFIKPHLAECQNPKDCHFNGKGYELLGRKVADEILAAVNRTN